MDLSRKYSVSHTAIDNTTNPITCFQSKVQRHDFREMKATILHYKIRQSSSLFFPMSNCKEGHIVLSFRGNLLHGSLETRRANWFLHCLFWSLAQCQDLSGLFSQMGAINRVCVFIWNGRGKGNWRIQRGRGEKKRGVGECRKVGDEGVKVVGV